MDLNGTINDLRKEFGKRLDTALAQEIQQRELEEAELEALANVLPEVIVPPLSAADEKKALKLIDDLDKKVEKLAELTAEIGQVGSDYRRQILELTSLLANKKHNIKPHHTANKLTYMVKFLSRVLETRTVNAVLGFCSPPTKEELRTKFNNYTGI